MIGGRAAWNVVTSLNDSEARNMGQAEHLEHDLRYDRADEFMEVVLGHWDTWEDDAIVVDKDERPLRRSRQGAPPGPQGQVLQVARAVHRAALAAGPSRSSSRPARAAAGGAFAARWGELIFVVYPTLDIGQQQYATFKDADRAGSAAIPTTCRSRRRSTRSSARRSAEAEDKSARHRRAGQADRRAWRCCPRSLNFDFCQAAMDEPFTDEELAASIGGLQASATASSARAARRIRRSRDFMEFTGRGTVARDAALRRPPKEVADRMEEWFTGGACDGFVIAATHVPGAYEDFVRLVVPELQRRGLFRKDYAGDTLRRTRPRVEGSVHAHEITVGGSCCWPGIL